MEPTGTAIVIGAYRGVLQPALQSPDSTGMLATLGARLDLPDAQVISTGRNRNVRLRWPVATGEVDLMVKTFGRETALKEWADRWRGSKARRTWRAACALRAHGVGTPEPLGYLERREGGRLLESYFISRYLDGMTSFAAVLNDLLAHDPECAKFMALLQVVADSVRAMHAAGFLHNDMGNQNILMRRVGDAAWRDVCFVDLNRGRIFPALTLRQRARDISRIYLPSDFLRVFMEMYFAAPPPREFLRWERLYRAAYAWHSRTRSFRHPLRAWRRTRAGGDPRTYQLERNMWVWDTRSAQAINVMRSADRQRYQRGSDHLRAALIAVSGVARVGREYRALLDRCYREPLSMRNRIAVAVDPAPATLDRELELLRALGNIPVLLRFYHHEPAAATAFRARAARQLRSQGHTVAVALVQDRRAVLNPDAWRDFVIRVLDEVADCAEWVELGHAVNRVKWGIWSHAEHRGMLAAVRDLGARYPRVRLMGPAAIDFEYPSLMAALRNMPPELRFHALSHHLYVDRRGAPENTQGGFSALHKFALARALARWSGCCDDRLVVSEVNWPIAGAGVFSPVGSPYVSPGPRCNDPSVSEDAYADYMVRYLLMAVASGLVERVYWWRLVARGFGLVDDTDAARWRERPAYFALKHLLAEIGNADFEHVRGRPPGMAAVSEPWSVLSFVKPDRSRVAVAYSLRAGTFALPLTARAATDALGTKLPCSSGAVPLDGRPVYLHE